MTDTVTKLLHLQNCQAREISDLKHKLEMMELIFENQVRRNMKLESELDLMLKKYESLEFLSVEIQNLSGMIKQILDK